MDLRGDDFCKTLFPVWTELRTQEIYILSTQSIGIGDNNSYRGWKWLKLDDNEEKGWEVDENR